MVVDGDVVDLDADVFCAEGFEDGSAVGGDGVEPQAYGVEVPGVLVVGTGDGELEVGAVAEGSRVGGGEAATAVEEVW